MTPDAPQSWRSVLLAGLISALLTGGLYVLTRDIDLGLQDEGFLWYGVIRTAAGEVPLRDFQSYEPGRYYWGAAWSWLFGPGILALRLSNAIFQAAGLFCGLLVARRFVPAPWLLLPLGAVLAVWMFPRHKLFEPSLAMMAVLSAVRLLEHPSGRRYLVSGIFVGGAACFGRNHGLYAGLGHLLAILLLHWKQREGPLLRKLSLWSAGILSGFAPLLLLLAFVPGFAERFVESILQNFERGTNLPQPIPWPWAIPFGAASPGQITHALVVGVAYVILVVGYPLALLGSLFTGPEHVRRRAVIIACLCIGLPYAHHAWVRAGPSHLAQSIHPLLLGLFALPCALASGRRRVANLAVWALLGLGAVAVAWSVHPELSVSSWKRGAPRVAISAAGDRLLLPPPKAEMIRGVQSAVRDRVPDGEHVFIAPFRVAYYPLLGRTSPVWDLYMLWRATDAHQEEMIEALESRDVRWALVTAGAVIDGRDSSFGRTHPKVMQYLTRNFEPVRHRDLPPRHRLLRRRAR